MARKQKDRGRKREGAQADAKAQEGKQRGQELERDAVIVKMEEPDTDAKYSQNEDRDEIDDLLDYVHVKLEDLELEDEKMENLAVSEAEENKGGAPLNAKKKKKKKKKTTTKKSTQTAGAKSEAAALPDTKTNIAPTAKDAAAPKTKKEERAKVKEDFLARWSEYFDKRELADWQRLCSDLGLPGDLPSKTQCRKALEKVHVNIIQFLEAKEKGEAVRFFKNVRELALYTRKRRLWVPINEMPKEDPSRKLLREIGRYV
ncbi:uncharacterized protein LY79DRAFT_533151 [Colletotrichum navitas]|uniref:Uncharacterized protein n=1 Tax=Colletotrichum navitas TaxID=681940 RepID=A0AAD8VCN2_9PEZI|nr:uncharacterized protein LY79DRAFT_533151 [Colletotrichum navitas]KAK1600288.1 hypothetical protein LY79DRAFT_533151 [Colletotrichum navitas]